MDTMSAKNFLQNTEVKFKVKMIATIIPAAIFLITILIEGITGTGIQIMQNIYLISGLILLVATGCSCETSEDCFNCVQMGMAAHTVYTV